MVDESGARPVGRCGSCACAAGRGPRRWPVGSAASRPKTSPARRRRGRHGPGPADRGHQHRGQAMSPPARAATASCAWCGATFEVHERPGPVPRYCKASHRQRAHEARLLAARTGSPGLDALAAVAAGTTAALAKSRRPDWRAAFLALARAVARATGGPAPPADLSPSPAARVRTTTATTVYECPSCDQRYLGERRCPDCNTLAGASAQGACAPTARSPWPVPTLGTRTDAPRSGHRLYTHTEPCGPPPVGRTRVLLRVKRGVLPILVPAGTKIASGGQEAS